MATITLRLPPSMPDDPSVVTGLAILENTRYRLTLRWSPRDDHDGVWKMDIADTSGTMRVAGVPLVASDDVLRPFHYPGRGVPPGSLRVTCDPDPATPWVRRDPGLYDFGRSARL
ncbi:MAG: hypothetical protein E6Q97_36940, partial [Desulfurellales bacterium]